MRKIFSILILLLHLIYGFAQEIPFEVKNNFSRKVSKEMVNDARTLMDINPGYPSTWISDYISSEIIVSSKGKTRIASGINDLFTPGQLDILKSADPGTDIKFEVKYKSFNSINNKVEINEMKFAVSLAPAFEAEFPGGNAQLKAYLKENAFLKVPATNLAQQAIVKFLVNEKGEINQVKIIQSSRDEKLDQLLLNTIANMPRWKPATDKSGLKVKQEFVFRVGNPGC